ncbi:MULTISPECIES: hypothetical protein [unclassified Caballeronia]|uniref:hypothetical protein n=1 Tax=unclassified Caballeronia TaxID=2646786 RepID=UPI002027D502|nr:MULTISPECIES: hypothetical protein [unclassified Caballeronia]
METRWQQLSLHRRDFLVQATPEPRTLLGLFDKHKLVIHKDNIDHWIAALDRQPALTQRLVRFAVLGLTEQEQAVLQGKAQQTDSVARDRTAQRRSASDVSVAQLKAGLRHLGEVWKVADRLSGHVRLDKTIAALHAYPGARVSDEVAREAAQIDLRRRFTLNHAHLAPAEYQLRQKRFEQHLGLAQWIGRDHRLHARCLGAGVSNAALSIGGYTLNANGRAVHEMLTSVLDDEPVHRASLFSTDVVNRALMHDSMREPMQAWLTERGLGEDVLSDNALSVSEALEAIGSPTQLQAALRSMDPKKVVPARAFVKQLEKELKTPSIHLSEHILNFYAWMGELPNLSMLPGTLPNEVRAQLKFRWEGYRAALRFNEPTRAQEKNETAIREELQHVLAGDLSFASRHWSARFLARVSELNKRAPLNKESEAYRVHIWAKWLFSELGFIEDIACRREHIKKILNVSSLKFKELENYVVFHAWLYNQFKQVGLGPYFKTNRLTILKELETIEEPRVFYEKMRVCIKTAVETLCMNSIDALARLHPTPVSAPAASAGNSPMRGEQIASEQRDLDSPPPRIQPISVLGEKLARAQSSAMRQHHPLTAVRAMPAEPLEPPRSVAKETGAAHDISRLTTQSTPRNTSAMHHELRRFAGGTQPQTGTRAQLALYNSHAPVLPQADANGQ